MQKLRPITPALIIGSNRQVLSLIHRPFDWVEGHSPSEHFRFEIGCMFLPLGGLPHAKPRFFAKPIQFVVSSQCPTRAKMHHGEGRRTSPASDIRFGGTSSTDEARKSGANPDNRNRHRQAQNESPGNRQGELGQ
jgi:hypothetical protein